MKKGIVLFLGVLLIVSSCTNNTAAGVYMGGEFGHVIGSAIGGITGGWRGHHTGALIGTVGGMVAGAAIGSAIDNAQEKKYEERMAQRSQRPERDLDRVYVDDVISMLEIRHAEIFESNADGVLKRGEECTVVFEIHNTSDDTIYDVCPFVEDATGNKHIKISPNLRIESIAPHQGIRYTASILADKRLKDGEIVVRLGVAQGGRKIGTQTREFRVPTAKK
jgi:uncharacterized protein YcfJ